MNHYAVIPDEHAPSVLANGACMVTDVFYAQVGPHICLFKTHVDIFDHWDTSVAQKLRELADKHGKLDMLWHVACCMIPHLTRSK